MLPGVYILYVTRVDIEYATKGYMAYTMCYQEWILYMLPGVDIYTLTGVDIVYTTGMYTLHEFSARFVYFICYQWCIFYTLPGCLFCCYQGYCNVYVPMGVHIIMIDHPIYFEYLLVDGLGLS